MAGGYFLMTRMGMGGCGMGHSHNHSHAGGGRGSSAYGGADEKGMDAVKLFDPVNQQMLPTATPIASVHQRAHVYYFEDRTNRDAFESEPEKCLAGAPPIGQKIAADVAHEKKAHRAHGSVSRCIDLPQCICALCGP